MVCLHSLADRVGESLDRLEVIGKYIRRVPNLCVSQLSTPPVLSKHEWGEQTNATAKCHVEKTCNDPRAKDHIQKGYSSSPSNPSITGGSVYVDTCKHIKKKKKKKAMKTS